jgi:ABC-type Fe3+-hydroxamate transport system substrate-binding protein
MKYFLIFFLPLIFSIETALCEQKNFTSSSVYIFDSREEKIQLNNSMPLKIVSFSLSYLKILRLLLETNQQKNIFLMDANKDKYFQKNLIEEIELFNPSFIIAEENLSPKLCKKFEDQGWVVVILNSPQSLDDIYNTIATLGTLIGNEYGAEKYINRMQSSIKTLAKNLPSKRPLVYCEIDASNPYAPWTPGKYNLIDLLIYYAGGKNISSVFNGKWQQISIQDLVKNQPEYLIIPRENSIENVQDRPLWKQLKAIKNQNVIYIDQRKLLSPSIDFIDTVNFIRAHLKNN